MQVIFWSIKRNNKLEFIEQLLTVYEYASLRHFDEGRLFIT